VTGAATAVAGTAAQRWRAALAAWQIPPAILAGAAESPWTLPTAMFAGRTRTQLDAPSGTSYDLAIAALPAGGSVLDVGAGAGAASLALRDRAGEITAIDENAGMLATFADLAVGTPARTIVGRWPEIAARVDDADIVVCHHVLYNVPDLDLFVTALTSHARRRVVVEMTPQHPASLLNPLWSALHGIERPTDPTAADAIAVIAATGVEPHATHWRRPITRDGTGYDELVASTCLRLCLGPDRRGDVEAALRDLGVGPDRPYLGEPTRDLVTIWWQPPAVAPMDRRSGGDSLIS
jgi:ubiquinone/menaquinone biosynthesis C-methylase UbiE